MIVLVFTCGCMNPVAQTLPPPDVPNMTTGGRVIAMAVPADEIDTPYPEARDLLIEGLTYNANSNRFREAIECYDRALAIDPDFSVAWSAKGVALHNLGRYDEAITCYDRALSLDPGNEGIEDLREITLQDQERLGAT
ncbi:MAG: tetratricopeptide repeat protein [Methanolinea sp.]|nr:tetratricopeptide repeat protein [Methanolinea sp.]